MFMLHFTSILSADGEEKEQEQKQKQKGSY
jgi:hypothetical protein